MSKQISGLLRLNFTREKLVKKKIWPIQKVQTILVLAFLLRLLFYCVFSGVDTTSCPPGKSSAVAKALKNPALGQCADVFLSEESLNEDVIEAGELVTRILFGGSNVSTLGELCCRVYKKKVLKGCKALKAEVLPPHTGLQSSTHWEPTTRTWPGWVSPFRLVSTGSQITMVSYEQSLQKTSLPLGSSWKSFVPLIAKIRNAPAEKLVSNALNCAENVRVSHVKTLWISSILWFLNFEWIHELSLKFPLFINFNYTSLLLVILVTQWPIEFLYRFPLIKTWTLENCTL